MDLKLPVWVLVAFLTFTAFLPPALDVINTLMIDGYGGFDGKRDKSAKDVAFEIEPEPKVTTVEDIITMLLVMDEKNTLLEQGNIELKIGASNKRYKLQFNTNEYWSNHKTSIIRMLRLDLETAKTYPTFKNEARTFYTYDIYGVKTLEIRVE